jgi:transposase
MKTKTISGSSGSVGIDIGKADLHVCRVLPGNEKERLKTSTGQAGLVQLRNWLRPGDRVALESGNQAFRIAKFLLAETDCEVFVLNAGDLAVIYRSMKKTDKEDSLKLARLIDKFEPGELPVVAIPSDDEEEARRIIKEREIYKKQIVSAKNHLHSIALNAGLTHYQKRHFNAKKNREKFINELPERFHQEARRSLAILEFIELQLKEIEESIQEKVKEDVAYASIVMSMPGIAVLTAFSIYATIGDCRRFSSAGQVAYYAGLVPRVDISGEQIHYGNITKRGNRLFRKHMVQAAWGLVHSNNENKLSDFYRRLAPRIGHKKAVIALARKMTEILFVMLRNGMTFDGTTDEFLMKKLKTYKIIGAAA